MKLLQDILNPIGGVVIKGSPSSLYENVITRKKNLKAGSLFFCLDRNLYDIERQIPLPACIIVTDRVERIKSIPGNATIVKVENIKNAYNSFLSYHRNKLDIPIIAITGTYGKTTTKEMIKYILSKQFQVKATLGNYNLFRSNASVLANIPNETEYGVFEFGVGKTGHLERCSKCFGPFTAVITGIGADHIERYGSLEKYRKEKSKIFLGMGSKQKAILNADCENTRKISREINEDKIIWFGLRDTADFRAKEIKYTENGMEFLLLYKNNTFSVSLPGFGTHYVYNALAAIAALQTNGVDIGLAIERLKTFRPLKRHLEVTKGMKGTTLIDDTWNTNSGSISAALTVLNEISKGKTTIAVLGKISELGIEEENEHKKIAQMVTDTKTKKLITIGKTASIIGEEAINIGMDPKDVYICQEAEEVLEILSELAGPNSIILVKTSMRESFRRFLKDLKKQT